MLPLNQRRLVVSVPLAIIAVLAGSGCQTKPTGSGTPPVAKEPVITCQSISQQNIGPGGRMLHADLPKQGSLISVMYKVRDQNGGPWKDCAQATICNGAVLPSVGTGSQDADGATVFDANVQPQTSGNFLSLTAVRLVVNYTAPAKDNPVCLSESTWPGYNTAHEYQQVYIPESANRGDYSLYFRPLVANASYKECDGSRPGGPSQYCSTTHEGHNDHVDFTGENVGISGEKGTKYTCGDGTGFEIRCRAVIGYVP